MKFGICTGFIKSEDKFEIPNLDFMVKMGFDYLELALNAITPLNEDEFDVLKNYLNGISLPVTACNCFMEATVKLTGENYNSEAVSIYAEKAVSRAAQLGVKKLVLGSAGSRNIPAGYNKDLGYKQFLEGLGVLASKCHLYGIELELEHLNKGESNIITSFIESAALAKSGKYKSVKSIFDYYHFDLGGEELITIENQKAAIGHIHFARTLGRTFPELKDINELMPVFEAIKKTGYNDTFSMECSFPKMEEKPSEYILVLKEFKRIFG